MSTDRKQSSRSSKKASKQDRQLVPVQYPTGVDEVKRKTNHVQSYDVKLVKDTDSMMYTGSLRVHPPATGRLRKSEIQTLSLGVIARSAQKDGFLPQSLGICLKDPGSHRLCYPAPKNVHEPHGGTGMIGRLQDADDSHVVVVDRVGTRDGDRIRIDDYNLVLSSKPRPTHVEHGTHSVFMAVPTCGIASTAVDPTDPEYTYCIQETKAHHPSVVDPVTIDSIHYTGAASNHEVEHLTRERLEEFLAHAKTPGQEKFWKARLEELRELEKNSESPDATIGIPMLRAKTGDIRLSNDALEEDKLELQFSAPYRQPDPEKVTLILSVEWSIDFVNPSVEPVAMDKFKAHLYNHSAGTDSSDLASLNTCMSSICVEPFKTEYSNYVQNEKNYENALAFLSMALKKKRQIVSAYKSHRNLSDKFDLAHTVIVNQLACLRTMMALSSRSEKPVIPKRFIGDKPQTALAILIASSLVTDGTPKKFIRAAGSIQDVSITADEEAAIASCFVNEDGDENSDLSDEKKNTIVAISHILRDPEEITDANDAFFEAISSLKKPESIQAENDSGYKGANPHRELLSFAENGTAGLGRNRRTYYDVLDDMDSDDNEEDEDPLDYISKPSAATRYRNYGGDDDDDDYYPRAGFI